MVEELEKSKKGSSGGTRESLETARNPIISITSSFPYMPHRNHTNAASLMDTHSGYQGLYSEEPALGLVFC